MYEPEAGTGRADWYTLASVLPGMCTYSVSGNYTWDQEEQTSASGGQLNVDIFNLEIQKAYK